MSSHVPYLAPQSAEHQPSNSARLCEEMNPILQKTDLEHLQRYCRVERKRSNRCTKWISFGIGQEADFWKTERRSGVSFCRRNKTMRNGIIAECVVGQNMPDNNESKGLDRDEAKKPLVWPVGVRLIGARCTTLSRPQILSESSFPRVPDLECMPNVVISQLPESSEIY